MPQDDINQTYKADQFRNQNVVPAEFKVVEFRGSDPSDLSFNPKRIWARTDTGELKYSVNGIDVTTIPEGNIIESLSEDFRNYAFYTYNLENLKKVRRKDTFSAVIPGDSIGAGTAATNNLGFTQQLVNACRVRQNFINYDNIPFYFNNNVGTWTKEETGIAKFMVSSKSGSQNLSIFPQVWNIPQADYKIKVVYSKRPDGGTFQVAYGSGLTTVTTLDSNGPSQDGIISAEFTIPAAQNLTIVPTTGQKAYINSVIVVRDSTRPYFAIDNWSFGGRKAGDFTNDELVKTLTYFPKDLLIWELLANDYGTGSFSTYVDRVNTVFAAAKGLGMDILITITCGSNTTPSDPLWESQWKSFLYEAADTWGAALIDYDKLLGGYTQAFSNGLIADSVHPSNAGHLMMANALCEILLKHDNPYSMNIVPSTSDSRYPHYGCVQDNRKLYYPNTVVFDEDIQIKSRDNNGNPKYVNPMPINVDTATLTGANFPRFAPRGSIGTLPSAPNPEIWVNTTDWGSGRNVQATWNKGVAIPRVEQTTSLPTATSSLRGRFQLITNDGVADDVLYVCVRQTAGTYTWKQVTLT